MKSSETEIVFSDFVGDRISYLMKYNFERKKEAKKLLTFSLVSDFYWISESVVHSICVQENHTRGQLWACVTHAVPQSLCPEGPALVLGSAVAVLKLAILLSLNLCFVSEVLWNNEAHVTC
jgi:hypothetical protein